MTDMTRDEQNSKLDSLLIGIPEKKARQIREEVEKLIEEAVENERDDGHVSTFNF